MKRTLSKNQQKPLRNLARILSRSFTIVRSYVTVSRKESCNTASRPFFSPSKPIKKIQENFMALVCSISGYPPEDPVISRDGYIFERRLIEKVISDTGACPVTRTPLSIQDLRPVITNSAINTIPVDATSLPSLIRSFESEWNKALVESFELKSQLYSAQEDLAKALYEQEASTRLVADLQRERDQALAEIARLQEELAQMHYSSDK